jgi:hypothetical protein
MALNPAVLADWHIGVDAWNMAQARTKPTKPAKQLPADSAPPPEKWWTRPLIAAGLAIITFAIYSGALGAEFSILDDDQYVQTNPEVLKGLTGETIAWAFTHQHAAMYHPLTTITHMADVQFFGLNPTGHHLVNILLHCASSVLLFLALLRLTHRTWPSAFVAAVFAWHPQHVESVAWVSERKDVLCAFFFMLCLLAYTYYVKRPNVARYLIVLIFFAMGLLSKPMLVTLPLILLLLDYWPLKRSNWKRLILEKIPLFVLTAIACIIVLRTQQAIGAVAMLVSPSQRMENAILSVMRYVGVMFWPTELSVFYPHPFQWPMMLIVVSGIALILLTAIIVLQAKGRPWLLVGWGWFLIMLGPVIGIVQVGIQAMADRYSYLPSIGLSIAVVWLFCELFASQRFRLAIGVCAGMMLLICCIRTVAQVETWKNPEALFRTSMENTGEQPFLHSMLAQAIWNHGRREEAIQEWRAVLRYAPNEASVHSLLGSNLLELGQITEAESELLAAERLDPDNRNTQMFLAALRQMQGRYSEAIAHVKRALQINPDDPTARAALAELEHLRREQPGTK